MINTFSTLSDFNKLFIHRFKITLDNDCYVVCGNSFWKYIFYIRIFNIIIIMMMKPSSIVKKIYFSNSKYCQYVSEFISWIYIIIKLKTFFFLPEIFQTFKLLNMLPMSVFFSSSFFHCIKFELILGGALKTIIMVKWIVLKFKKNFSTKEMNIVNQSTITNWKV